VIRIEVLKKKNLCNFKEKWRGLSWPKVCKNAKDPAAAPAAELFII
jgi:hypothetical protein